MRTNDNNRVQFKPYYERIRGYNEELRAIKSQPLTAEQYEKIRKEIEKKWQV